MSFAGRNTPRILELARPEPILPRSVRSLRDLPLARSRPSARIDVSDRRFGLAFRIDADRAVRRTRPIGRCGTSRSLLPHSEHVPRALFHNAISQKLL
jgi:hypothetical protein